EKKAEAARIGRENKEKWNRFYRRLRDAGVGPRKMWEVFGVEDEEFAVDGPASSTDVDDLYNKAAQLVVDKGKASISMVQRELGVGYGRATRLIDQLEAKGVIGPADESGSREVLVTSV
ncbi:MAG: DNA translocase FtsK, partial [Planctomycetaceae bacterium]